MDVRFLNPFLVAVFEVLEKEVQAQIVKGKITLEKSAYTTEDVSILIGLTGQVEGMVIYGMSEDTAKSIVSRMMGQDWHLLDEMAQSAIGELGNMITGHASMELSKEGFESRISPPMLIVGDGTLISTLDIQRLIVPLKTQYGMFNIHLALRNGRR